MINMTIPLKIFSKKEYDLENKKPDQEKVWDFIAKPWKTYVVKGILIVEEFLENKKGRVVDLGCGSGRNMIPNKCEYYGVDFSKEQLNHTEKYMKKNKIKGKLFKSKLNKLPEELKDEMFDYGLLISSLHCLENKEERLEVLKEFYRILKKQGEALISVWNSEDSKFNRFKDEKCKDVYIVWRDNGESYLRYYYLFSKDEFISLLKTAGFEIVEFYKADLHDRFSKKNWIIKVRKK